MADSDVNDSMDLNDDIDERELDEDVVYTGGNDLNEASIVDGDSGMATTAGLSDDVDIDPTSANSMRDYNDDIKDRNDSPEGGSLYNGDDDSTAPGGYTETNDDDLDDDDDLLESQDMVE